MSLGLLGSRSPTRSAADNLNQPGISRQAVRDMSCQPSISLVCTCLPSRRCICAHRLGVCAFELARPPLPLRCRPHHARCGFVHAVEPVHPYALRPRAEQSSLRSRPPAGSAGIQGRRKRRRQLPAVRTGVSTLCRPRGQASRRTPPESWQHTSNRRLC